MSNRYILPIDAIFTIPPDNPLAYPAYKMGWKIGAHSSMGCLFKNQERWKWAFDITFLDCEYKKYNHDKHVAACKLHRPKYTTVRDLMTKKQCDEIDIEYFDFDTIMKFAEDIEPYTDNVIVIPKYDCLSDIPKQYMLGYSFPSKYGATPLSISEFLGWRIHLLGGSWQKQRKAIITMGKDIVSFDNNNLWKISRYGSFNLKGGKTGSLKKLRIDVTSPMYASVMLSLGGIASDLHTMQNQENNKVEHIKLF
jgi:hypothetical protein